jgi:hypothetical protein
LQLRDTFESHFSSVLTAHSSRLVSSSFGGDEDALADESLLPIFSSFKEVVQRSGVLHVDPPKLQAPMHAATLYVTSPTPDDARYANAAIDQKPMMRNAPQQQQTTRAMSMSSSAPSAYSTASHLALGPRASVGASPFSMGSGALLSGISIHQRENEFAADEYTPSWLHDDGDNVLEARLGYPSSHPGIAGPMMEFVAEEEEETARASVSPIPILLGGGGGIGSRRMSRGPVGHNVLLQSDLTCDGLVRSSSNGVAVNSKAPLLDGGGEDTDTRSHSRVQSDESSPPKPIVHLGTMPKKKLQATTSDAAEADAPVSPPQAGNTTRRASTNDIKIVLT